MKTKWLFVEKHRAIGEGAELVISRIILIEQSIESELIGIKVVIYRNKAFKRD